MPSAPLVPLAALCAAWLLSARAPGPLAPDESLEAFLRRVREHELAIQATLRPRIERIVLGFEGLSLPPAADLLAALHAEIAELGDEALPVLVPWIDPGAEPSPAALFRATELSRALARRDLTAVAPELVALSYAGSPAGRRNALQLLRHSAAPQAEERLREAFEGGEPELRRAAAVALAMRRSSARAAFVKSALSDPDPELVGAVVKALAAEPHPEALDAVFALLARPAAAAPWMEPLLAYLAAAGPLSEERLAALVDLALDERLSSEVRSALIDALTRAGSALSKSQAKRLASLADGSDVLLREAALVCLARLGDRGARRDLLASYDELVAKNERWPSAFQKRADVLLRIGEPREAAEDYRRAIDLVQGQGRLAADELWIALARAWLRDGRLRQAHDALVEGELGPPALAALADDADFRALREHPRFGRVFPD